MDARRILVYGVTGSGKTTFARALSDALGIAWTEVDQLTFEPNWVPVPDEIQRQRILDIVSREEWILDTAYGKWIDVPLSRAELIIGLDYPRWVSFGRLLRRTYSRVLDRKPVCNGNVETLRLVFSRESILLWHFKSFARKRERIRAWKAAPGGPQVVHLRSPKAAKAWLDSLKSNAP